ncbi:hypothetical protein ScPMuIL_004238 [Solemya velum]
MELLHHNIIDEPTSRTNHNVGDFALPKMEIPGIRLRSLGCYSASRSKKLLRIQTRLTAVGLVESVNAGTGRFCGDLPLDGILTIVIIHYNVQGSPAVVPYTGMDNGDRSLKSMGEKLLEQDIPDQEGALGRLNYSLKGMRTLDIQWPRVALLSEAFYANNGAFCICGDYNFLFNGLMNFTGNGDFRIYLSEITVCLERHAGVIRQDSPEVVQAIGDHRAFLRDVRRYGKVHCRIGRMRPQFHGGSASLCQITSKVLMRIYRPKIEQLVSELILNAIKEDEAKMTVIISGLAMLADPACAEEYRTDRWLRSVTESNRRRDRGRLGRFFNSVRRRVGYSRQDRNTS